MPISLESNSATMLINQYAHGLAGKALPSPPHLTSPHLLPLSLPFPPLFPLVPFRVSPCFPLPRATQSRIHNEQPTGRSAPDRAPRGGYGGQEEEVGLCLASPPISLSRVPSFPLPVVHHLPFDHLPAFRLLLPHTFRSIPKRIQTANRPQFVHPSHLSLSSRWRKIR